MTPRLFGIIGYPLRHSLSPVMHNSHFKGKRLPYLYRAFPVPPQGLRQLLRRLKSIGVAGLNVTIPYKEKVIPYLDRLDRSARRSGAVNVIVVKGKKWIGYNTDGEGYLRSLPAAVRTRRPVVLLFGAGGAARGIVISLLRAGVRKIHLCNRTGSRATKLMRDLGPRDRQKVRIIPWQRRILQNLLPKTDLLINATPSDLRGILPSLGRLPRRAVVSDLVYTPLWTPLLKEARRQRRTVHPGYRMLLHQGALSYELWTGDRADLRLMKKGLLDALK